MRRQFLMVVGTVLLSGCAAATPEPPPPSAPSPLIGKPLPTIRYATLSGERLDQEQLRGRVVVIKFFATFCEPCKYTLPSAQRSHRSRPEVLFIGISEDERASEAQALVQLYGLTFPVVHDRGNVLAGRFRVQELPVTFVADSQGLIRYVLGPEHPEEVLDRVLDTLN